MTDELFKIGLPQFLSHFGSALVFLFLFMLIYLRITPYREIALIREGNTAAAASLSGSLLGYCFALFSAVAHSVNLMDMIVWSAVALLVQLVAYTITRFILPDLIHDIPHNKTASGILLGAISLGLGLINAACLTY